SQNCEDARTQNLRQSTLACRQGDRVTRREFIALIGGAAGGWEFRCKLLMRHVRFLRGWERRKAVRNQCSVRQVGVYSSIARKKILSPRRNKTTSVGFTT